MTSRKDRFQVPKKKVNIVNNANRTELDDLESSGSESEEEGVRTRNLEVHSPQGKMGEPDEQDQKFKNSFKDEVNELSKVLRTSAAAGAASSFYIKKLQQFTTFVNAQFQDILPQIVDGRKFIIDGDSLLMHALDSEGLSQELGGQTLHVIYIVENFLQTFLSRALNFVVVFFKIWDKAWTGFPQLIIARNALKLHLLHNQKKFDVITSDPLWSKQFYQYLAQQRPGFIMMSTRLPRFLQSSNLDEKTPSKWLQFVMSAQSAHCEFICLDVVDIDTVVSSSTSLMATVHVHFNNLGKFKENVAKMTKFVENIMPEVSQGQAFEELPEKDVKSSTIILAASLLLEKDSSSDVINVTKIVLLSLAFQEHLPLKMRCFKNLPDLSPTVEQILKCFLLQIAKVIYDLSHKADKLSAVDFRFVGDIWQGKFVKAVFHGIAEAGSVQSGELGNIIGSRYENLVSTVNKLTNVMDISPYPLKHFCEESCSGHSMQKPTLILPSHFGTKKLLPSTCKLSEMFCGELSRKLVQTVSVSEDWNDDEFVHEIRHWHSLKPLTDEYDRIPDAAAKDEKPQYETNKRYAQNMRNTYARYQTIYGMSLEGRTAVKAIVTNSANKHQNTKKTVDKPKAPAKAKQLSKKDKIIEDNLKRMMDNKQKQLKERLKSFRNDFSSLMLKGDFSAAIEKCDIELLRACDFKEFVLKLLLQKAKACFGLWSDECRKKSSARNLSGARQLFLVVREILTIQDHNDFLDSKQKIALSGFLHDLGFEELAAMKELPDPGKSSQASYQVQMNYVEFQLTQLGSELNRETGGKPDPRADGFIPDPWQVELFDIIDKRQSAVVVAPTSSGKTYASYYCMEQVIRDSDDGVVVYVCPTKALVNQVHATIYARFKKNLPPGKTLLGTFTRDFRQNVTNCQILTTVPECMELLLLSPRCQYWVRKIKYVIFDEVHCLVGQSGGLSWENSLLLIRCPFLALSATIRKPEKFCAWLQKMETFKKAQAEKFGLSDRPYGSYKVTLVEHLQRHNHLLKNVMMEDGTIEHVHPYSFINLYQYHGIPKHIVLSPDEAFELFNAMKKVLESEKVKNLDIVNYFKELCPSGFLSMQSVQKFCVDLRTMLEEETLEEQFKVLGCLKKVDYSGLNTSEEYVDNNITLVLDALKKKGMLPALVFSYNRRLVQSLAINLLRYLRELDDFTEDEETDIESDSETENDKKANKTQRRYCGKRYRKKLGLMRGPSMLKSSGSLRGEGLSDEKMIDFIEKRLIKMGYKSHDKFPSLLRRGLGNHFGGMNNKERSAVEMLFRSKVLNLVTATGTLALGIHMPCKTVVVAGDSPYINVLEFNQMSGRAGRRGFDKEGNVIFFGLHQRKMETLMTGNLPQMVGNFPLSASLILRLLLLGSDVNLDGKESERSSNEVLAKVFTLLENSLLYETQDFLKDRMKYFFSFVVQFLMRQRLLSKEGHPHSDALLLTHLHYHEPGNFAFYFLLKTGVLEKLCLCDKKGLITRDSLMNVVVVLSFLFARLPLSEHLLKRKRTCSVVELPELPHVVKKALKNYNKMTLNIFSHFFMCVSNEIKERYGDETKLPLSGLKVQSDNVLQEEILREGKVVTSLSNLHVTSNVCSVFAGLSGNSDQDLFPLSGELVHIREDLNVKLVPTLELKFRCNSYALDFYKHGIREAICHDNGLKAGYDFTLLKDFLMTLKTIHTSLSEMFPSSKLLVAVDRISNTFETNFTKAYYAHQGM